MTQLELAGAPLTWLWLFLLTTALALPPIVRGFFRRGTSLSYERSFLVQRAPQLAAGLVFPAMMLSFEAIELTMAPLVVLALALTARDALGPSSSDHESEVSV